MCAYIQTYMTGEAGDCALDSTSCVVGVSFIAGTVTGEEEEVDVYVDEGVEEEEDDDDDGEDEEDEEELKPRCCCSSADFFFIVFSMFRKPLLRPANHTHHTTSLTNSNNYLYMKDLHTYVHTYLDTYIHTYILCAYQG